METLEQRVGRLAGSRPVAWEPRAAPWQPAGGVAGGNKRFSVVHDNSRVFVKYAEAAEDGRLASPRGAGLRAPARGVRAPRRFVATRPASRSDGSASPLIRSRSCRSGWCRATGSPVRFRRSSRRPESPRSDNLCLRDGRAILVDWNHACVGNGDFDVAFWLPSLAAEGGSRPDEVLPGAGTLTAVVSGYFAAVAGLPPPEFSPTVRPLQLAQLIPAVAWARRELAL